MKTIKREHIEGLVLDTLQTHLMRDDLVKVFCEEYTKHWDELQRNQDQTRKIYRSEYAELTKEQENIIQAIKDGIPAHQIKDELEAVTRRREELGPLLEVQDEPRPLLHPAMAQRYRAEIKNLRACLNQDIARGEAAEHLRALIDKIVLTPTPEKKDLSIDLYGDLAEILSIASKENAMKKTFYKEKRPRQMAVNDNHLPEPSVELVAGAGFEPTTFGL